MKVTNLKIGKTYYMPQQYNPRNYVSGELVEITEDKKAVMKMKDGTLKTVSCQKLHKRADKAVFGPKAQERVRRELGIKSNKPTIEYKKLSMMFDKFMAKVDHAELDEKFRQDLLNKMEQDIQARLNS